MALTNCCRLFQSKRLSQNRLAARKSRQRRKEYVECLEEEVRLAHAAGLCAMQFWSGVKTVHHVTLQPCALEVM